MNLPVSTKRPSPILMLAPMGAILILYSVYFHAPQNRTLLEKQKKLSQLDSKSESQKLEAMQIESELNQSLDRNLRLEKDLREYRHHIGDIISDGTKKAKEQNSRLQLAANTEQVVSVLQRSNMICVEVRQSVLPGHGDSETATSNQARDFLASISPDSIEKNEKVPFLHIRLIGRFFDLQRALHSLQELETNSSVVGIEMESSDPKTDQRTWYLTVQI